MTSDQLLTWLVLGSLALATGCGGREAVPPPTVSVETPADEVLRIGERWSASTRQRGLLSPPSPISVFAVSEESLLTLSRDSAQEDLVVEEELELREGGSLLCQTRFEHALQVKWGRLEGEAAIDLRRPPLRALRVCQGGQHPEPQLERPANAARYVLRSDSLVAVEPPREDRVYLPLP